ncbi:pyridoxamine 5'-phosphate oxidase family protein [Mycolicibacterium wolinskyi]|uniref:pyridoxamine 5'-phosphate oxidase family protein n=1 Tax=Mycolicibacterium TaxID=1866885 RepID=UPI001056AD89|nr:MULTISPECIES: pyridoxamine 5'-phosphate oxidase family protein [Mycolicibacterium]MCV7287633.1 pyridoxamine 5'-phosphate oxidase family protein [Mycolicibacterium wolinskyi]MCV7294531.1 pyridoxamine 5'-phosphate oxidase family protein [Mycolicibacterium goodii]
MSTHSSAEPGLPQPVADLVNGSDLERKLGLTLQLVTVDEEGWPRLSLLSVGEVLAGPGNDIRLALHIGSRTTAALTHSGKALATVVLGRTHYKIHLALTRMNPDGAGPLAFFAGSVVHVEEDRVGYAELTSGITYRLNEPDDVLARWTRQIDELRSLT